MPDQQAEAPKLSPSEDIRLRLLQAECKQQQLALEVANHSVKRAECYEHELKTEIGTLTSTIGTLTSTLMMKIEKQQADLQWWQQNKRTAVLDPGPLPVGLEESISASLTLDRLKFAEASAKPEAFAKPKHVTKTQTSAKPARLMRATTKARLVAQAGRRDAASAPASNVAECIDELNAIAEQDSGEVAHKRMVSSLAAVVAKDKDVKLTVIEAAVMRELNIDIAGKLAKLEGAISESVEIYTAARERMKESPGYDMLLNMPWVENDELCQESGARLFASRPVLFALACLVPSDPILSAYSTYTYDIAL